MHGLSTACFATSSNRWVSRAKCGINGHSSSPLRMKCRRNPVAVILALIVALGFSSKCRGQDTAELQIGGATLHVTFDPAPTPALRKIALDWTTRAARAVTVYYTQFPVRHADILIHIKPGRGASNGHAYGDGGAHIELSLGTATTDDELTGDRENWMMTHEMVHLALPSVEEEHHWIEEGLATYVEPVARVRAGELTAQEIWKDMIESMPKGEPAPGDRGLDHTPTWGRTYWGGAMFCLLADVEIRRKTGNKMGLETALRTIIDHGGSLESDWPLSRVLATGDQGIGQPILESLYARLKDSSAPVDLQALWQQLGVEDHGGVVVFHDDAPLAGVRKAITAP